MRKTLFESLTHGPLTEPPPPRDETAIAELAKKLDRAAKARLGRSLSIRQVDAGSCNGCELEIHALGNAFYDLAGGDKPSPTTFKHPLILQESILASLKGNANAAIISAAIASLQILATQTHTKIEITTAGSHVTLQP